MSSNKMYETAQPVVPIIPNASESVICEQDLSNELDIIQPHLWVDENGIFTPEGVQEFGCEPSLPPKDIEPFEMNLESYPELARALGYVVMEENLVRWNGHTTQPDIES